MSEIDDIRKKIDEIDKELLEFLNKRAALALKIKQTGAGKTIIRPERENQVVERLAQANTGPLPTAALREIFTQIIGSFRDQMQLDRPISVAYLGPAGTYSEQAAIKLFGKTTQLSPEETIKDVFRSAEAGSTDLAVVPVENSSEGAVRETHKLLMDTNANIVAEISIPIIHSLLTNEKNLDGIKTIYAHPQSFSQCRVWLATHLPKAEQIPCSSNAAAAELAAKSAKSAAIAGSEAASIYKLDTIEKGINDQPGNETRFVALGSVETRPTGNDKTSMICVLIDRPGVLYDLLKILADAKISMTRLESQPFAHGQYAFYIDFIGHKDDQEVKQALSEVKKHTYICKILGSYHREVK